MDHALVVGIDVGIRNFAMVTARVTMDRVEFTGVYKYDLINHSGKVARMGLKMAEIDGLSKILNEHRLDFLKAHVIIVEKQPPQGILSVQAVLYDRFPNKVILMSPQRMHRHHAIHKLDYEGRKNAVESIARECFQGECKKTYESHRRQHDIADAACFVLYYASLWRKERSKNKFISFAFKGQRPLELPPVPALETGQECGHGLVSGSGL